MTHGVSVASLFFSGSRNTLCSSLSGRPTTPATLSTSELPAVPTARARVAGHVTYPPAMAHPWQTANTRPPPAPSGGTGRGAGREGVGRPAPPSAGLVRNTRRVRDASGVTGSSAPPSQQPHITATAGRSQDPAPVPDPTLPRRPCLQCAPGRARAITSLTIPVGQ